MSLSQRILRARSKTELECMSLEAAEVEERLRFAEAQLATIRAALIRKTESRAPQPTWDDFRDMAAPRSAMAVADVVLSNVRSAGS